ncbi:MAG TPA: type II secretion system F family protein [Candidatus Binatia bacterium]|nr:type II secretion system F family protein [Candidatus Binatia bacterium]
MPVFTYRALTTGGRGRSGVLGAESARAAWQALRTRGIYPTELREARSRPTWRRPAAEEMAAVTRQLATLVEAGIPVDEALVAAAEQAEHPALVRALTVACSRLREGEPLADALAASPRVFPRLFPDLVRAGEASGALAAVLARLADHVESAAAVRARLRAALTYPLVMTAATAAVLVFLLLWVVPEVTRLFAETGTLLPLPTRVLVGSARVGRVLAGPLALVVVATAAAFARWGDTAAARRRLHELALRVPILGPILAKAAVARAARALATLLAGGVPLEPALAIAEAGTANPRVAAALGAARVRVGAGEPLAAALRATGAFPSLLVRLAAAGEGGGRLAPMLERAAVAYERDVEAAVATATALIEPAMVLVMGAVVLALVTAVLLPLLDLGALAR